ncbi:NUDIX hydrolase [Streptomyces sp. NPDC054919]
MSRIDRYNDPTAPKANSVVPSVTAIVCDGSGRLLLIHKTDNDLWALPGGGHDIGESVAETVIREVAEETGIAVEVDSIVGLYTNPHHVIEYDDGEVRQQFSICFRAHPIGGSLRTSSESKEVRWIDPADLAGLDIHPSMRLRITHGLDGSRHEPYIG